VVDGRLIVVDATVILANKPEAGAEA